MKAFYVDQIRKGNFTLLAGPFPDEATARKYVTAAAKLSMKLDPLAAFDSHGVVSITEYAEPGALNDRLSVDPADLVPSQ